MIEQDGHDKAVDWWSLGILMYEMITGVTPFYNENRHKLMNSILNSKVVFPDRAIYRVDYSDTLSDLIVKLLDKDKS